MFSGGGAKGAYGAGAAKAIMAYRKYKGLKHPFCCIGTSAGALNAVVLATLGVDSLIEFWKEARPGKILGWPPRSLFIRILLAPLSLLFQCFYLVARFFGYHWRFSLYSNRHLKKFISDRIPVDLKLEEKTNRRPIIICATNYSKGQAESLYSSEMIDLFVDDDNQKEENKRRLQKFLKISDRESLVDAMLASSAIPVAFPPILFNQDWYVDGGVGNNTPTREAALFLRRVDTLTNFTAGDVFCVLQDEPGTVLNKTHRLGPISMIRRVYDLFHYTQMLPVIAAWFQINRNVEENVAKVAAFEELIQSLDITDQQKDQLTTDLRLKFGTIGGNAPRLQMPLHEIRPAGNLGDLLDFSHKSISKHIEEGYRETLKVLNAKGKIDEAEFNILNNTIYDKIGEH